jgi:leader peptidase (prepilin peptidase) / N-methyltransferase
MGVFSYILKRTSMIIALSFGILGAIVGSFVGVVAERMNTGQSYLSGRSRCNSCARFLTPLDLVPVISWLLSKGKCRTCKARVPASYAVLELSLGVLFALSYLTLGLGIPLALFLLSIATLAFIVVYDLRHTIVPPSASTALVVLSLLYLLLSAPSVSALGASLMTAGIIGAGFLCLHVFSNGRAMGLGDTPVALGLSFLVAPYAFSGVLFSFWIGALYGVLVLVLRRGGPKMGIEVPFVPFLALGFLLAYFTGWNPLLDALVV